ncbi:MAG: lipoprotein [Burkholderiaceae bacterium]|nr:lipoprotein [Burkholderiaceae bacterium]
MLIAKQILVSSLVLGAGLSTLTGCGQTGALYLPTERTQTVPSSTAAKAFPPPLPAAATD